MAIVVSVLTGGVNNHQTTSEEANAVYTDFVSQGVQGTVTNTTGVAPSTGSFAVNAQGTPDTTIAISAGVAYVTGTPTSQNSQKFRVKNSASTNLTISANSSGSTKYDWIYIKLDATKLNAPNTAGDDVATIVASRSSSASADDGTPPTYGIAIAVVTVANGFSTITNSNIRDVRTQATVTATGTSTSQDWYSTGYTPSTVTYNGNRSYSLTFTSTDLTSFLSPGMRIRTTRTVSAPTQCTDLESGSTQYYSKSSPSAMTFTDDFVVSAWVKLESYTGAIQVIASRYDGTSGWLLKLETDGRITIQGNKASSANYSIAQSYQSVPLGRWVHIAAQLDMSAFTATTTTSYIMIDGVDVPAAVYRAGTNPTALVQAGNLEIGSTNGGTLPFDGKIAQLAIYNAKVTQATIRTSISQTLSGTETSLISAYSFNNSINDLSANANNLTANGAAVATNTDSPFAVNGFGTAVGTTDYAIVTSCTFSTNTTLVVQVPEGCTIPTSGGVSAVSYSTQKTPYGFPSTRNRWQILSLLRIIAEQTSASSGVWYNPGSPRLDTPIGDFELSYVASIEGVKSSATPAYVKGTLSTASNSESDVDMTTISYISFAGGSTAQVITSVAKSKIYSHTASTIYYLNVANFDAGTLTAGLRGDVSACLIKAEIAYL